MKSASVSPSEGLDEARRYSRNTSKSGSALRDTNVDSFTSGS